MINMISGKTLAQLQAELGVKEGLEAFNTRCTGTTLGLSLLAISCCLVDCDDFELGDLKGNLGSTELEAMKHEINLRLDQMGLVGFRWEGDTLKYYPFKEHEDVKEIIREVEVKVAPTLGEVVEPRSYRVVEHLGEPTLPVGGVEQSYPEVHLSSDQSNVVKMEPIPVVEPNWERPV